jgi:hypothetical protein
VLAAPNNGRCQSRPSCPRPGATVAARMAAARRRVAVRACRASRRRYSEDLPIARRGGGFLRRAHRETHRRLSGRAALVKIDGATARARRHAKDHGRRSAPCHRRSCDDAAGKSGQAAWYSRYAAGLNKTQNLRACVVIWCCLRREDGAEVARRTARCGPIADQRRKHDDKPSSANTGASNRASWERKVTG